MPAAPFDLTAVLAAVQGQLASAGGPAVVAVQLDARLRVAGVAVELLVGGAAEMGIGPCGVTGYIYTMPPPRVAPEAVRVRAGYSSGRPGADEAADTGEHVMPAPVALIGQSIQTTKHGTVTVERLLKVRNKFGRRRYLCRREAGGTIVATSAALRRARPGPFGRPFKRAAARTEHRKKAVRVINGKRYHALGSAAGYLKVSSATIHKWRDGCPYLDGRNLVPKRLPGGYGRTIDFYAEEVLDQILTGMAELAPVPDVPGYVYTGTVRENLGWSVKTLHRRMKRDRVQTRKVPGKSVDNRPRPLAYIPRRFYERWLHETEAAAAAKPADKVTAAEAADVLGMTTAGVQSLVHRGELAVSYGRVPCAAGYARRTRLLSRAEVEARASGSTTASNGTNGHTATNGHSSATAAAAQQSAPKRRQGRPPVPNEKTLKMREGVFRDHTERKLTVLEIARRWRKSQSHIRNILAGRR